MSEKQISEPDFSSCKMGNIYLKISTDSDELLEAKKLRHFVFFEEPKGIEEPSGQVDEDEYDKDCEHLLVIHEDENAKNVVGTYRLLRRDQNKRPEKFYTSTEYDISKLLASDYKLLELGRSCIHPDFRDGRVIQLLWKGIGIYIASHNIDYMFGCGSFSGDSIEEFGDSIAYLLKNHKAPEEICPVANPDIKADIDLDKYQNIDKKEAFSKMPALLKGYIRSGCMVGDGAVIDSYCKTIDVCIVMDTARIAKRYSQHFVKK